MANFYQFVNSLKHVYIIGWTFCQQTMKLFIHHAKMANLVGHGIARQNSLFPILLVLEDLFYLMYTPPPSCMCRVQKKTADHWSFSDQFVKMTTHCLPQSNNEAQ